eukprot:CAMPEP_0201487808 /NCGR_PEP_ID=MMETSP0151_2-20130828/15416_1 /ASSEMBLY_ACC=CAM_ASM_000257 /TAXON_ID=200890 /ORGANISM="Paramoeba atlantica, Strain 621/1 / CCAP 1560/9" /LENGTH=375 /DNA_ID=CAMNT_0047872959 /DNA_START=27 /DNA_END=1154 /DNA_ORIENTATION=+
MAANIYANLDVDDEKEESQEKLEKGDQKKKKKKKKKKSKTRAENRAEEVDSAELMKENEELKAKDSGLLDHDKAEIGDLTPEQQDLVEKLRRRILDDPDLPVNDGHIRVWLEDTQAFKRFLVARSWNFGDSEKLLVNALQWRFEYKPWKITVDEVEPCLRGGHMYSDAFDRSGHSCVYMRQHTKPDPTSDEVAMKYMMWSFEMAMFKMLRDTSGKRYKMVWFVSNAGYNPKYMRSMKFVRELSHNVQNYYPERLHRCYFFYAPMMFKMFWGVVKPFLDPITRSKFSFVCGSEDSIVKNLSAEFDLETVEDHFFGKKPAENWDEDTYVEQCRQIEKEMREYYDRREAEILAPPSKSEEKPKKKSKNRKKKEKAKEQ